MEQQVERIENINPARKNAKKSKELRQTLLQSDKPEEFRRAFFEHWIRPHYTPEALERRKRIHYANRTYLLVILSLAAHWWEKVGRDQAKKLGCWKAAPSSSLTSDQIAGATNPFPKAAQKVIQEIKRAHPSKVPVEMQFQLYVACGEDLTLFKTAITKNLGKSEKSVPRWIRNVQSKE
ncbi:hypothetical protein HYR69_10515 [Candidatus Sumerlaeota bacterium]|nr:hypothetical protein [Candidatus Sumerlaeota bacterium]